MHTLKGDWILIQDFYCWVHDIGSAKHKLKRMPSYPGLISLNSICHIKRLWKSSEWTKKKSVAMERCRHCTEGCILGDNSKRDVKRYISKHLSEYKNHSVSHGKVVLLSYLFDFCISFLYWVSNCKFSSTCVCVLPDPDLWNPCVGEHLWDNVS